MSLTSQLKLGKKSPVRNFLSSKFPNTSQFLRNARKQVRQADTIRPASEAPWTTLGTALDYRLRYYFDAAYSESLVAYTAAQRLSAPDGGLSTGYRKLFDDLEHLLKSSSPVNTHLAAPDEDELNRYCVVLAAIEEHYRSGKHPSVVLGVTEEASPPQFLKSVKPHWLEDLRALSRLFYDKCGYLLELPVTLNPTFAGSRDVGGADADLIVDGTILEVKSTIQARIKADFVWQLLGYVLLDYEDEHDISSIGIYMARQGLLFQWPLMEAVSVLSGRESPDLLELRARFREEVNPSNASCVRSPSP